MQLFIGDFHHDLGPSNVNKEYKKNITDGIIFFDEKSKLKRIRKLLKTIGSVDGIIVSGLTYIGFLALILAKLKKIKVIYLMHGDYSYEIEVNREKKKMIGFHMEKKTLELADGIICVSENFMRWVKDRYVSYSHKIYYVNNGVNWHDFNKYTFKESVDRYQIATIGGGRPQKNIIMICEALIILNKKYNENYHMIVIGNDAGDLEKIRAYNNVKLLGKISHKEVKKNLAMSNVYVQNSIFESFGLAPMEALTSGCSLLISENVGAKSIMKSLENEDIISDCKNPYEIAEKIHNLTNNSNNLRLIESMVKDETSWEYASKAFSKIVRKIILEE